MKKLPKQVPVRIKKLVDALAIMFDVSSWEIHVSILKEEKGICASMETCEDYQRLFLNIYPPFFRQNLSQQREDIVHEFCHIITLPLVHLLEDYREGKFSIPQQIKFQSEKATSKTTNLIAGLLDGQYLSKRKAYKEYLKLPKKRGKKK